MFEIYTRVQDGTSKVSTVIESSHWRELTMIHETVKLIKKLAFHYLVGFVFPGRAIAVLPTMSLT